MRRAHVAVFVHLVWATWDRLPLLTGEIEARVHRAIGAKAAELGVEVVAIGGIEDHVHLLVRLPATLAVAELVKQIKGASAHLVTHDVASGLSFKWQGAYGAFSVGPRQLPQVVDYIASQRDHHAANATVIQWEHRLFDRSQSAQADFAAP
ncbi:MAG: IS200/IS605 family transposase [Chloroflexota bacterium]|nr:IS200/IS605 family transposase [Chloroflexota bacterium]